MLILCSHWHLPVSSGQVQGGNELSFSQSVNEVIDMWNWIGIFFMTFRLNVHSPPTQDTTAPFDCIC